MLAEGGQVIGIMLQALVDREVTSTRFSELRVVTAMHERKTLMAKLSDKLIALPGGLGTLEALFAMLTWAQLGLHRKPCGVSSISMITTAVQSTCWTMSVREQFLNRVSRAMHVLEEPPERLLERFEGSHAPAIVR